MENARDAELKVN